jgi:hypothetical protein
MTTISTQLQRMGPTWVPVLAVAIAAGALIPVSTIAPAALLAASFAAILLAQGRRTTNLALAALFGLLVGYAFLGRGFAYLGVAPAYIGEFVLALAALGLIVATPTRRLNFVHVLLLAFMGWGALRTVPYISLYGSEAFRDAVAWGYASFAIFVSLVLTQSHLRTAVTWYARMVPIFVIWVPLAAIGWYEFGHLLPTVAGGEVRILHFKPGDMAVHLAGAAAFLLAGLHPPSMVRRVAEPLFWTAWLAGIVVVSAMNRGGMLAVMLATSAVFWFVRSFDRWILVVLTSVLLLTVAVAINVEVDVGRARTISVSQLVDNIESVIGESDDTDLTGTREWREEWWDTIIDYTIRGPYFWDGKGYGINLAQDDGFRSESSALRAPHNAHLQFLARGGVPSLALWLALQAAFAFVMLRSAYRCARAGQRWWLGIHAWIFAYWIAALVNMTFDVYIEGPQGGIVFWSLYGLGLAVVASSPRQSSRPRPGGGGWGHHGTWRPPAPGQPSRPCPSGLVDLNSASAEQLTRLVHIGPRRAAWIVQQRPFVSVDGLLAVPGIGPGRLANIKAQRVACAVMPKGPTTGPLVRRRARRYAPPAGVQLETPRRST